MTDENNTQELKDKIAELEKQLEESKNNNSTFDELKEKYEKIIEEKNNEISDLNKTVEETKKKVDSTVNNLNDEVQAKLEATEAYKDLLATVEKLEKERAEAASEAIIKKGLATPSQQKILEKWCMNDPESYNEFFEKAEPIIDVSQHKSKKINADITRLRDYFKQ